jgi:hypothetical protein
MYPGSSTPASQRIGPQQVHLAYSDRPAVMVLTFASEDYAEASVTWAVCLTHVAADAELLLPALFCFRCSSDPLSNPLGNYEGARARPRGACHSPALLLWSAFQQGRRALDFPRGARRNTWSVRRPRSAADSFLKRTSGKNGKLTCKATLSLSAFPLQCPPGASYNYTIDHSNVTVGPYTFLAKPATSDFEARFLVFGDMGASSDIWPSLN